MPTILSHNYLTSSTRESSTRLTVTQKANNAWSIARLWVVLFLIQSSLVSVAFNLLPRAGQIVLLIANALAYLWSITVLCETLHARYVGCNAEEQELHDLIGGLA